MVLMQAQGIILCPECGIQKPILMNSEKPSYRDPPKEVSYFAYKRINHFNEFFELLNKYLDIIRYLNIFKFLMNGKFFLLKDIVIIY